VNALIDLLLEIVTWLIPWPWNRSESHSVVGESDLDRKARRMWIWTLAILLTIAAAASLWLHFKT
jgi:hypothetical protein